MKIFALFMIMSCVSATLPTFGQDAPLTLQQDADQKAEQQKKMQDQLGATFFRIWIGLGFASILLFIMDMGRNDNKKEKSTSVEDEINTSEPIQEKDNPPDPPYEIPPRVGGKRKLLIP